MLMSSSRYTSSHDQMIRMLLFQLVRFNIADVIIHDQGVTVGCILRLNANVVLLDSGSQAM